MLVQELKAIRRGRGVTALKLKDSPILNELFDDVAQFEAACRRLGGSKQAQALYNAYAFGMDNPWSLTRRRNEFAVAIAREEGRTEYHVDTVELWENQSIEELAELILPMKATLPRMAEPQDDKLTLVANWFAEEFDVMMLRLEVESAELDKAEAIRNTNHSFLEDWMSRHPLEAGVLTPPQRELVDQLAAWQQERADDFGRLAKTIGRWLAIREVGILLGEIDADNIPPEQIDKFERFME